MQNSMIVTAFMEEILPSVQERVGKRERNRGSRKQRSESSMPNLLVLHSAFVRFSRIDRPRYRMYRILRLVFNAESRTFECMTSHFRVHDMHEKVARAQLGVSDFVFKTANLVFTTTNLVRLARFFGAPPTDFNVQTDDTGKKGPGTRG